MIKSFGFIFIFSLNCSCAVRAETEKDGHQENKLIVYKTPMINKFNPALRRSRPIVSPKFAGNVLFDFLGGTKGKYCKHHSWQWDSVEYFPIPGRKIKLREIPPNLNAKFIGGTDTILSLDEVMNQLKILSGYLNQNRKMFLTLSGNTGFPGNSKVPVGNGKDVLESLTPFDGEERPTSELMIARAEVIKKIMVQKFHVKPNRIRAVTGIQYIGIEGRNVSIKIDALIY